MITSPIQLRIAHIDIGRQPETIDVIKQYILMASKNGYNAIELYLEWRIRTQTFPCRTEGETVYTPEEMRKVAAYAAECGMEIIPVVSALSCARQLLKYKEFEHLAELREPYTSRFLHHNKTMICPSQPEIMTLLENYYSEIADIFPGRFFHIGCDETWEIGRCDLCKKRIDDGETESEIFLAHILKTHKIISQKLNRRMMMWDDMFEFYPDLLAKLPRDIIMVSWNYDEDANPGYGHFSNHVRRDRLGEYDALGFEYFICPAEFITIHNIESFTAYAARRSPLGCIFASWEKWDTFMQQSFPWIAYAGRLLASNRSGRQMDIFKSVVMDFFGVDDEVFTQLLYAVYSLGFYKDRAGSPASFMQTSDSASIEQRARLVHLLATMLPQYLDKIKEESKVILRDTILTVQSEWVAIEFKRLVPAFFTPCANNEDLLMDYKENLVRLESLAEGRIALWNEVRNGIAPCNIAPYYAKYIEQMHAFPDFVQKYGFLKVHFFLPDQFCAPRTDVFIRYEGVQDWIPVAGGQLKCLPYMPCFYTKYFAIDKDKIPVALKVEVQGFGGQGFTYMDAVNTSGCHIPNEVFVKKGNITNPEFLLDPDWKWCYAGDVNVIDALNDRTLERKIHSFEIRFINGADSPDFRKKILSQSYII